MQQAVKGQLWLPEECLYGVYEVKERHVASGTFQCWMDWGQGTEMKKGRMTRSCLPQRSYWGGDLVICIWGHQWSEKSCFSMFYYCSRRKWQLQTCIPGLPCVLLCRCPAARVLLVSTPAFVDPFIPIPGPVPYRGPTSPQLCICLSVSLSLGSRTSLLIKYTCFVKLTKNSSGLVCTGCWQWIKGSTLIKWALVCLWAAYISMLISHMPGSCLLSPTSFAWLESMQMDGWSQFIATGEK